MACSAVCHGAQQSLIQDNTLLLSCESGQVEACDRHTVPKADGQLWQAGRSLVNALMEIRSHKCVQALLGFRLGCHNLPRDVGSRTAVPRSQRLCTVCHVGQPGDEYHLVSECQGLQHIRDRYPGLFEHRTMVQFMWPADLCGVAKFVTDCLGVYYDTDPRGGQPSDQP